MATHIQALIDAALHDHLKTLTLPHCSAIAFPNVNFKAPSAAPYLRVQQFPNKPINPRIAYGKDPVREGLYQVSVFTPAGAGAIETTDLAGLVADHFTRGTKLTAGTLEVLVLEEPTIAPGLQEKTRFQIPVTVPWIAYPA